MLWVLFQCESLVLSGAFGKRQIERVNENAEWNAFIAVDNGKRESESLGRSVILSRVSVEKIIMSAALKLVVLFWLNVKRVFGNTLKTHTNSIDLFDFESSHKLSFVFRQLCEFGSGQIWTS